MQYSKMVLFYLSRLDSCCFFNLILIVFDVLNYVRSGQSESVDGSYQAQVCRVLGWHPSLMPKDEANEGAIKFFFLRLPTKQVFHIDIHARVIFFE